MTRRLHTSEMIRAQASCDRCSWNVNAKNAQALAAQHHDKRSGHRTTVEITTRITYGGAGSQTQSGSTQGSML